MNKDIYTAALTNDGVLITTPTKNVLFSPKFYSAEVRSSSIHFTGGMMRTNYLLLSRGNISENYSWYIRYVEEKPKRGVEQVVFKMFDEPSITFDGLLEFVRDKWKKHHTVTAVYPNLGRGDRYQLLYSADDGLRLAVTENNFVAPAVQSITNAPTGVQIRVRWPEGTFKTLGSFGAENEDATVIVYNDHYDGWDQYIHTNYYGWLPIFAVIPHGKQDILSWAEKQLEA